MRLQEWAKILFFVCIVASNLIFLGYWGYKMYKETRSMIVKKMEKLYLICCVCMNRQKLERDKEAVRIAEENELLREDYYKTVNALKKIYESG